MLESSLFLRMTQNDETRRWILVIVHHIGRQHLPLFLPGRCWYRCHLLVQDGTEGDKWNWHHSGENA